MKSKIMAICMVATITFTGCGNTSTKNTETPASIEKEDTSEVAESGNADNSESTDTIEVEKELFDVIINIPADLVQINSQEELDAEAEKYGYKAILNEDGSATYTMTKSQHKKMMADFVDELNHNLTELIGSEDYPNFTDVQANDDFTEFTVTTSSTELDMNESFSVMLFYIYGGLYNVFSGNTVENISVTFINSENGEIISTANSSDMAE